MKHWWLLGILMLAALTAAPAAAQQTVGVGAHLMWGSPADPIDTRQLDLARDMGAQMVRVDAGWVNAEEAGKGRWSAAYLAKLDSLVSSTQLRGMRLLLVWWRSPLWATSVAGVPNAPPADLDDYGDALAALAVRYRDRPVDFEVWNEPNSDGFFQSPDNARDYAALLKAAYRAVKAVNPRAVVIGGSLAHADATFTRALYAHGIKGFMDGFAIHPYTENRDPLVAYPSYPHVSFIPGIRNVRDVQEAYGDVTSLWLTEFGWNTGGLFGTDYPAWRRSVTLDEQADYVRKAVDYLQTVPYVANAAVYLLRDDGTDPLDDQANFGLVRRDYTPKPAYRAFREAAAPVPAPPGLAAPAAPIVTGTTSTSVSLDWGSVAGRSHYRVYIHRGGVLLRIETFPVSAGTVRRLRPATTYAFGASGMMPDGRETPLSGLTAATTRPR